jgi:hypothetical protein
MHPTDRMLCVGEIGHRSSRWRDGVVEVRAARFSQRWWRHLCERGASFQDRIRRLLGFQRRRWILGMRR